MGLIKYLRIKDFFNFLSGVYANRRIIIQLVRKDIKGQYLGSFLGITWSFVQPLAYIAVISLVFSIGLRGSRQVGDFPFLLYLISGITVWFFFADCLNRGAASIQQNNYLVKKIVFRVSMLPVVKILSAFFIHSIFLLLVLLTFMAHGFFPDLYYLQLFYYLFAAFLLTFGLALITSAVVPFFRDMQQIIHIIIRIGFWFTPIFWNIDRVPAKYQWILKLNPAFYLIQGYRDALIHKNWFWQRPHYTLYFWLLTILILAVGSIVFRRLKPHFADVL